jgi:hypothetical protein
MRAALRLCVLAMTILQAAPAAHAALDPKHAAWTALLAKHVRLLDARGSASRVDYTGFARDRAALQAYLAQLAQTPPAELARLPRPDQIAFLINAYNAATIELILGEYPRRASIRDYGSLFRSAWQRPFVRLLGETLTLDQIEHERLRGPRGFAEPRVHFALNCASIGCPMLREEAYVGARLEAQLDEQAVRFLSDRSRNRYTRERGLELSKIFDWYEEDFGPSGPASWVLARYADAVVDDPEQRSALRHAVRKPAWSTLDYDWRLNDDRTPSAAESGRDSPYAAPRPEAQRPQPRPPPTRTTTRAGGRRSSSCWRACSSATRCSRS